MARSRLRIFATAFCLWTGSLLVGCGGSEQAPPPPAKQVVKGKIPAAAKQAEPEPARTVAAPAPAAPSAPAKAIAKPEPVAPPAAQASAAPAAPTASANAVSQPEPTGSATPATASAIAAPTAAAAEGALMQPAADPNKTGSGKDELLRIAGLKRLLSLETDFSYDPEGKIDPFTPVFDIGAPEGPKAKEKPEESEKRIPESPIEMVDLSQLKLTGVILAPSGNLALVQDATGKGYVIYTGTYIGNREGQVTKILSDRLIVTEKTRDDLGRTVTEARELKLPKPPGEM